MEINAYLGQKGYTISKNELTVEKQKQIRNDLTIKPFVMGSPMNDNQKSFPAYRESANKFYVPHYYGVENFGPPKQYKVNEGTDINLEFAGILRDYQEPVVNKFIQHCNDVKYGGGLLELPCAWGKTSASLYVLSKLKKKALVIVHKEFLMNQWIERIQQFLPKARVGKIQGQIIDIEDKDIVIGMLQSLSMKEYPASTFETFGLTIIDEVHHISSEVFSNSLFKLVTKYMLGLSATMNRKDGTTKVFKMFLGEVIFKVERKGEHNVEVRAITFKTNDDEFNETTLDYRGNPQISTMISKLCSYNKRTEFVIKVLVDFIEVDNVEKNIIEKHKQDMNLNNPECEICKKKDNYLIKNSCCSVVKYCLPCMQEVERKAELPVIIGVDSNGINILKTQRPKCPNCKKGLKYEQNYIENPYVKPLEHLHTLILAHNLNVLHYMYNKIVCKNLASVGYYVGGMSEQELKKSEKKQVILASFSMASEALDIPSLNAEFLITPKTDIVQCVGRVLRAKHSFSNPIIYDIKDSHDVFVRQWLKRKAYYKKQNYNIIECDSNNYNKNTSNWKITNTSCKNDLSNVSLSYEDEEIEEKSKDKYLSGTCFLKMKK